jgi:hypothetical protein
MQNRTEQTQSCGPNGVDLLKKTNLLFAELVSGSL